MVNLKRRGRRLGLESREPLEGQFGVVAVLREGVYGDVGGKSDRDGDEGQLLGLDWWFGVC